MSYDATMAEGARRYRDVIDHLRSAGFPATFTQTGGMCAALEICLEAGWLLLVTDAADSLAWERSEHQGWSVGLYPPDSEYDGEPRAFSSAEDGSTRALPPLVFQ